MKTPHIDALTSLRFGAALHVVIYHLWSNGLVAPPPSGGNMLSNTLAGLLRALMSTGYVSVSLFFVLSGFILAHNYLQPGSAVRVEPRRFWAARFARIYPVYLLGLMFWAPLACWLVLAGEKSLTKTLGGLVLNLCLLQAWFGAAALSWNGPGWSLSVEAFFYACFPRLGGWLCRQDLAGLARVALTAFALGMLAPAIYLWLQPDHLPPSRWPHAYFDEAPWLMSIKFMPLLRLPEFVLGLCAGLAHRRLTHQALTPKVWPALALLAVGGILTVLCLSPAHWFPLLHNGLLAPLFAGLILALANASTGRHLLGHPSLILLGESSYALYLLHGPLLISLLQLGWQQWPVPRALSVSGYLVGATLLSILVFKTVETPGRLWLRRLLAPQP